MYHDTYDVIVAGGGHAGCEAALAAGRIGCRTLMLNLGLDNTALMPCNPSIGGPAKGHLVREVSALGGEQARAADASLMLIRWLNTSKGFAVRALRAQCDPKLYAAHYMDALQALPNLDVHQDEVVELLVRGGHIEGVRTRHGSTFMARAAVLASGTYLDGRAYVGEISFPSGPMGQPPARALFDSLTSLGVRTGRMRTDTTPRLHLDTIDLSQTRAQHSEPDPLCFDLWGEKRVCPKDYACYFSHTTPETHAILAANIHRSALVTGMIETLGPRYCPSLEDKFLRFPDRDTHPLVFEPISNRSKEVYVQNFSTGLPYDVQVALVRSLPGCKNAKIIRPGYAIEYVYLPPEQLSATLENREIGGFFCAGQVNGTSGYEEAAAQGLLAGINAALHVRGEEPVVLSRAEACLGVLVDDLTTKGTAAEPYRMFTSRCEHRLLLRHDNADRRLSPTGRRVGLIDDARWEVLTRRWERADAEMKRLLETRLVPAEVNPLLTDVEVDPLSEPVTAAAMLRRRNVTWDLVQSLVKGDSQGSVTLGSVTLEPGRSPELDGDGALHVETELRYAGYIGQQERMAARMASLDNVLIPAEFDYDRVKSLLAESRQKLSRFRPRSLGQALRISGVTPSDVQLLSVAIKAARAGGGVA
ncbi:MAG: tRNA uridine-5-carboxymethylaminomethyl(34) synthesis enzyme MnmG [Synergistaceae bacterium]|jgi:tRNA uridine 5-carboxymethylaminomethyl modification enzyme|nr:tRNA uridine-5-carboxymethylaminomethyl(34) synthesis enzyme MnmG [Synergistaceae bacterium]